MMRLHQRSSSKKTTKQTDFAEEVVHIIKPNARILDLGCGLGEDDVVFAQAGHTVIATDFAEVAIQKNSERLKDIPNLRFEVLDMSMPFPYSDNEFDVVYARLSLHYFTDEKTKVIVSEIRRVLKPNGYLCFVCKSTKDELYGQGAEIEKDMFEENGHVRHFFSEEYARALLEEHFTIDKIGSEDKKIYTRDASFIKVIAHAVK
jgi:ubiquinone/menaquinone biosynthesis C-methylase UbiE